MISLIPGNDTPRSWQRTQFGSVFSDKRTDELGKPLQKMKDRRTSGKRWCRKVKEDQKLVKVHKVERKLYPKVENWQNTISKVRNGHKFVKKEKRAESYIRELCQILHA
jgi:thiamine kinase-like enzyme